MIRILIKWMNVDFPDVEMMGIVSVSRDNDFYGQWLVTVHGQTSVIHRTSDNSPTLPPICDREDVMEEVEHMAKTYYAGIQKADTVHKWVEDDGSFKQYNNWRTS